MLLLLDVLVLHRCSLLFFDFLFFLDAIVLSSLYLLHEVVVRASGRAIRLPAKAFSSPMSFAACWSSVAANAVNYSSSCCTHTSISQGVVQFSSQCTRSDTTPDTSVSPMRANRLSATMFDAFSSMRMRPLEEDKGP